MMTNISPFCVQRRFVVFDLSGSPMSRNHKEKGGGTKCRAPSGTGKRRSHQESRLGTLNKSLLGLHQSFCEEVRQGTVSKFAMVYQRGDGTSFAFTSDNLVEWVSDADGMKELFQEAERGTWKKRRIRGDDLNQLQARFPTLASGTVLLSLADLRALLALLELNLIRKSLHKKICEIPAHMVMMLDSERQLCIDMGALEVAGLEGDEKDNDKDNDKETHGSENHSSATQDANEDEDDEEITQDELSKKPRSTSGRWTNVRNADEETLLDYSSWQGPFTLQQRSGDEAHVTDKGRFLWVGELMDAKALPISKMTRGHCLVVLRFLLQWYNPGNLHFAPFRG
jgi:hypothetical protein